MAFSYFSLLLCSINVSVYTGETIRSYDDSSFYHNIVLHIECLSVQKLLQHDRPYTQSISSRFLLLWSKNIISNTLIKKKEKFEKELTTFTSSKTSLATSLIILNTNIIAYLKKKSVFKTKWDFIHGIRINVSVSHN